MGGIFATPVVVPLRRHFARAAITAAARVLLHLKLGLAADFLHGPQSVPRSTQVQPQSNGPFHSATFILRRSPLSASACRPASVSQILVTSMVSLPATTRSAFVVANPARTSWTMRLTGMSRAASIASVHPSGQDASSSSARRRLGLGLHRPAIRLPASAMYKRSAQSSCCRRSGSMGDAPGTAQPFPLWRLHSGPRSSPIDQCRDIAPPNISHVLRCLQPLTRRRLDCDFLSSFRNFRSVCCTGNTCARIRPP
jgi:hypothetical protein